LHLGRTERALSVLLKQPEPSTYGPDGACRTPPPLVRHCGSADSFVIPRFRPASRRVQLQLIDIAAWIRLVGQKIS
jgi:hypothetical protein